jgi:flagellar FliJ protein
VQKFKFKLEKVLDYRHQEEGMRRQQLAQLRKGLDEAEDKLDKLFNGKKELQIELKGKEKKGIDLHESMAYRNYIEVVKADIERQKELVSSIRKKVEECRQKLLNKRKECKTLSKLKEKAFKKYQQEFLREEQKKIDEVATSSFNRQREDIEVVI